MKNITFLHTFLWTWFCSIIVLHVLTFYRNPEQMILVQNICSSIGGALAFVIFPLIIIGILKIIGYKMEREKRNRLFLLMVAICIILILSPKIAKI